jgi:preprotein translocase subunit Sec61beta
MLIAGLKIDPLAIAAIGFLLVVIVISIVLFAWLMGQMKKQRGEV